MNQRSATKRTILAAATAFIATFAGTTAAVAAVCPDHNPNYSIMCTGGNSWCGNTCQSEPVCVGEKSKVDCSGCGCVCPDARPNDCTGVNGLCQETNATCAALHKQSVCDATPGATIQRCGNCVSGYSLCAPDTCVVSTNPACPPPAIWDPCAGTCSEKYVLANPTPAQSPQSVNLKMSGNMSLVGGDVYLASNKALRLDGAGPTLLNIGNWDLAGTSGNVMVWGSLGANDGLFANAISTLPTPVGQTFADLPPNNTVWTDNICFNGGTRCRNSWPIGLPEIAIAGQTVRYTGSDWVATSFLTNTGTAIGIGTDTPGWPLDVRVNASTAMLNLDDQLGTLWTGVRLARVTGVDLNKEKWFVGMNNANERLSFIRDGVATSMTLDTNGRVGIGIAAPSQLLNVYGGNIRAERGNDGLNVMYQLASETVGKSWSFGMDVEAAGVGDFRLSRGNSLNSTYLSVLADSGRVGLKNADPGFALDVSAQPPADTTAIVRIDQGSGAPKVWTGYRMDRVRGAEQWFLGMNDTDETLRIRSSSSDDRVVIDSANGNVGIGDSTPAALLTVGNNERFTVSSAGDVAAVGNLAVGGGQLTTTSVGTANVFNTSATGLNIGGAASNMSIGPGGATATSINLAGGDTATGCTLNGATGDLACSGNITGGNVGNQGYWSRSGTTLQPKTAGDNITTSGNISTTGTGALNIAGNAILGDGPGHNVIFGAGEAILQGGHLNFDYNTFYIDAVNNRLGFGTNVPGYKIDVSSSSDTSMIRLDNDTGASRLWTGLRMDRVRGTEKWFLGMNATDESFRLRRDGGTDDVIVDSTGKVGIGSTPSYKLDVAGTVRSTGIRMETGAVNNYVLTSDVNGQASWRPMQYADECTGGKFHHLTAGTYDGNDLGNYKNVDNVCDAGNHICTPDEILRTVYCSASGTLPASGNAWVANGAPGFTKPASNDCAGWTSEAANTYGDFWEFQGDNGGTGYATSCNAKYPIACCRAYWWL
ncbi:MAG: hypothetical protein PHT12_02660 [Patescibacteria group bacterium]|nr:hypothetical protein [Patescibacteria group bacterium]